MVKEELRPIVFEEIRLQVGGGANLGAQYCMGGAQLTALYLSVSVPMCSGYWLMPASLLL